MSFMFKWPKEWNKHLIDKIITEIENKINSIDHGITLIERITIPGTTPPKLELLKINEMTSNGTNALFHLKYQGNAKISFKTKANLSQFSLGTSSFLAQSIMSKDPMIQDFTISIQDMILDGDIKIVAFYNLEKVIEGETLKLKLVIFLTNNPMKNIKISTDISIPLLEETIQSRVEEIVENLSKKFCEEGIKIEI